LKTKGLHDNKSIGTSSDQSTFDQIFKNVIEKIYF